MIVIDCEQYSDKYWKERLGKPTASGVKNMITPTGKISSSADFYAYTLADQIKNGVALDTYENEWMKRGHELEPKAREIYQIITGKNVSQTGMIFKDEKKEFGCSPDAVGIKNGVEIKCPSYEKHMRYRYEKKLPGEYAPQVYTSLWVCDELKSWDFFSYYPGLKPFLYTVRRDNEDYIKFIEVFEGYLPEFLKLIKSKFEEMS